jgi:hypothetical protein
LFTHYRKIVASTDKEITSKSWIPDSFIPVYVKSYNNKTPIKEVRVETETYSKGWSKDHGGNISISAERIKTRPDGSIIIHQAKTYTKDEILLVLNNIYGIKTCTFRPDCEIVDEYKARVIAALGLKI